MQGGGWPSGHPLFFGFYLRFAVPVGSSIWSDAAFASVSSDLICNSVSSATLRCRSNLLFNDVMSFSMPSDVGSVAMIEVPFKKC